MTFLGLRVEMIVTWAGVGGVCPEAPLRQCCGSAFVSAARFSPLHKRTWSEPNPFSRVFVSWSLSWQAHGGTPSTILAPELGELVRRSRGAWENTPRAQGLPPGVPQVPHEVFLQVLESGLRRVIRSVFGRAGGTRIPDAAPS